jgi:2-iminobutanoate/2-iminopropanoate deaminase
MPVIQHNPADVFPPYRGYSHATEIRGDARLLIISGLNGYQADGKTMPASFEDQGELIWQHLGTILRAAEMDYRDLVSVRVYLASPDDRAANTRLRTKFLGEHCPALTVVCCQLLDPAWKLEIEAMAAK